MESSQKLEAYPRPDVSGVAEILFVFFSKKQKDWSVPKLRDGYRAGKMPERVGAKKIKKHKKSAQLLEHFLVTFY